ncbi:MAG: cell filamentation protein Fic [Magnetovibrio sp.]|nr:cell filamentation protein Fic [Magnetovibrio sp.]
MGNRETGRYQRVVADSEEVSAFVPHPLPPTDPPLVLDGQLADRLRHAEQALTRLDLAGEMVPSLDWFIYAFVRKEAVISSQIEGTQASLVDLLSFEAEEEASPNPDVEEVCNHVDALTYAREQIADARGLPLSMRLLNETHSRLMKGVRGAEMQPGQVRRSQNWISGSRPGNAVFVPPPHHVLPDLLGDFEKYIHGGDSLPPLVRAGLLHAQFETIHPYLDGNGRIGRLLITLLLEHWGLLDKPLLYLSLFFKRNQLEYYRRLGAVRTEGDWEGWIDYFLDGIATIAEEAIASVRELFALVAEDRARVLQSGTASVTAVRLFELLPRHPIVTVASTIKLVKASKPTATRAIGILEEAGILVETTGRRRGRSFAYQAYLDRLRVGTDLEIPR